MFLPDWPRAKIVRKKKPRPKPGLEAKMRVEAAMMASTSDRVGALPDSGSRKY
jgi:hypothetical protein